MKTDATLQSEIIQELKWDPSIHHEAIGVAVEKGVVSLSGHVPSYFEKISAERAVKRVAGVRAVVENIAVDLPGSSRRDDSAIAQAIADNFSWNVQVPEKKIQIRVENGVVTLTGLVEWSFQKEAAEKSARKMTGVRNVINQIVVKTQKVQPDVVKKLIEEALVRSAEVEARKISVQVDGDTVTLNGTVHSHAESDDARWAAWCAQGVSTVKNNLQIQP